MLTISSPKQHHKSLKEKPPARGKFTSSLGFIFAATGSAVGLGNIWKFPYLAGENGGAVFLITYLVIILVLGIPIMLAEMAIGRTTKLNPIGAYRKLNKKYTFVGVIGVVCAFVILSYYSVIGGWVIKYIVTYLFGNHITNPTTYFTSFIAQPLEPIVWHIVFMVLTCVIVIKGIANGIERASKILLPLLFVILIVIVFRSVTLPNSLEGIKYFLVPKLSDFDSFSDISGVFLAAMGQAFFSLSLGMGALITYGSYLTKEENLQRNSYIVPALDTLAAVLAGFAVLPAVFAFGFEPSAGPGLLFQTLPKVFEAMPFGFVFGLLFFVLAFFAAITSSVSLLEVVVSFCIDNLKMKRKVASVLTALVMTVIGGFASLSFGAFGHVKFFGSTIFGALSFFSDKLLLPLGGFFMCIFVGYVWGIDKASEEITNGGKLAFAWRGIFSIIMKFIAPAIILIIFVTSLFS